MDFIFPRKCVFCGRIDGDGICIRCKKALPYITGNVCMRCGKPIGDGRQSLCDDCAYRKEGSLDAGVALWEYSDMTRPAMRELKYGGCMTDVVVYADELTERCADFFIKHRPQLIVPVPVHKKRARFRGYNQAELLAVEIGERLGVPVGQIVQRVVYTKPLMSLSAAERKKDLEKAFLLTEDAAELILGVKSALIVDDIYTTGSTVEVCASLLKDAGIEHVYAAYLCIGRDY